ncbi:putative Acidic mammalian chitinase [Hypsibius exemplaris]|uniref:Metalloendopeptidase n=1 Tax=Hypsibius exemplaris TaxID=2072580 RepID=A0A9X6NFH6_HYPEX|nr:putative Acidic mammalian chitinase [Hypsibius exemplaris]
MKRFLRCIWTITLVVQIYGRIVYKPNPESALDDTPLAISSVKISPDAAFEGDIVGIDVRSDSDLEGMGFNGVVNDTLKWKSLVIPFAFSKTFLNEPERRQLVLDAMDVFEKATCLKFVQRTTETQYLQIFADPGGCYSNFGKQAPNPRGQPVALNINVCFKDGKSGIAQHEIMHAIGFFHEQSRLDRDEYVDINWSNIQTENLDQFQKHQSTAFGEPYDFGSVLHYEMYDFAIDKAVWTIRPKEQYKDRVIGQRDGLSATDIRKINKMYNCTKLPTTTPTPSGPSDPKFDTPHRGCYYSLAGESRPGKGKFTAGDLDMTLCTYITVAFGSIKNGRLTIGSDLSATLDKLKESRDNSNANAKIFLSVGGPADSATISTIARDASKSHAFAHAAAQQLRSSGLDGLDIMYQQKAGLEPAKFVSFIQVLQRAFAIESYETDSVRLAISLVVFSDPTLTGSINAKGLDPFVDIVNVAAYDFAGTDRKSIGHPSPKTLGPVGVPQLYNMEFLLNLWLKRGFQKSKLVAGLPFYGHGWLLDDSTNHDLGSAALQWITASAYTIERGTWPYFEICQRIKQDEATNFFDPNIQASYAYTDAWGIGYDDVETIRTKTDWARLHGFGVYAWDVSQDDFRNLCGGGKNPLLNAIKEEMNKSQ